MASFKDYCPDDALTSKGVKLYLADPNGSPGKQFVLVRWRYSDEVRAALDKLKREGLKRVKPIKPDMTDAQKEKAEKHNQDIEKDLILNGLVSLVAGWSFDEKPTVANIKQFLKSRPDLVDRIEARSMQDQFFFINAEKNS